MSILTRRQFLASTSIAAAGTALSGRAALADAPAAVPPVKIKTGVDTMTLGKSGIKTSVLGIGTGTSISRATWARTVTRLCPTRRFDFKPDALRVSGTVHQGIGGDSGTPGRP